MALATVADLKKYMDITFSNTQEEAAQMILTGLEADLEHYIGSCLLYTSDAADE